eukprot:Mycagemm_TRINITY_DN9559_c0_g2::TRINITY_DN9559_c0_g2_i1::g.1629::m.1629 type:complete len:105 gc:universal TRINITY_DN9559_c0_g2_i1:676-990(+)
MGGGGDLEQMRGHRAAQRLADLVHLELHRALAVEADHGRHVGDRDPRLLAHHLGDDAGFDAVVHGDAALVRDRRLELHVLHGLEDVGVHLGHLDTPLADDSAGG